MYDRIDLTQGGDVAGQQGPTLRQQKLGAMLKQLRQDAGVSQTDAAKVIDGTQSKISKIENGRVRPRRLEVNALLDCYGVPGDDKVRTDLLRLWRVSPQAQYLTKYDMRADMREMVELESTCDRMEIFATMHLPGLLQTADYAEALIRGMQPTLPQDQVDEAVQWRVERQQVLHRDNPPSVFCVLDEGVIQRPIGGFKVAVDQLHRLLELARLPHVTIQVVPFRQDVYPGLQGPFRILINEDDALDVVDITTWARSLYMQDPEDVRLYRTVFDDIRSIALSSPQSVQLITSAIRDFEKEKDTTA